MPIKTENALSFMDKDWLMICMQVLFLNSSYERYTQNKEKRETPKIGLFYNKQHATVDMTVLHSYLPFSHTLTNGEDCIRKAVISHHKPNPCPHVSFEFQWLHIISQDNNFKMYCHLLWVMNNVSIHPRERSLCFNSVHHLSISAKTMAYYCYAYHHQDP